MFELPPDKKRWIDIAINVGLTKKEAEKAYIHFGANNWKRANQLPIESWVQVPFLLTYWRNNKHNFPDKPIPVSPEKRE